MRDIHSILREYWGYAAFRPLQQEIIETVLAGCDCLALLPTGGGKSLCFQVPALAKPGLCLVISPLIALMKDQVENLRRKNITAFSIHSGLSRREVENTLQLTANSNCKFLYVSPERIETKLFLEYLPSFDVNLIAVDEAHCISQWGYDFRPSYLRIATLREELPRTPVLALTASATAEVQEDVCKKLVLKDPKIYRQSFARPNLSYSAFSVASKINKITSILQKTTGTAIVYCKSRKRTREISELLNMQGIIADFYHAGLSAELRTARQDNWLNNQTRVMVCTNAFGMGIDKPDVRVVIHADLPESLEHYYQEAGRAGRDLQKSYAVLLYNESEIEELKAAAITRFPDIKKIREVYGSLMNHLQIPSATGEGRYYDIDLPAFCKQFQLKSPVLISVLKTLEQEDLLSFNEQLFTPAKLQITAGRERLFELEEISPGLDALLKHLLRTYEGIKDQQTIISEAAIARSLRVKIDLVKENLERLQKLGFAEYHPQKEQPQIYLRRNRVVSADLQIDNKQYLKRKEQFIERTRAMIEFAYPSTLCRSMYIGRYFGDCSIKPCGICDNCLQAKKTALTSEEFASIHSSIVQLLEASSLTAETITEKIKAHPRYKTIEVIRFLTSENKLLSDASGHLRSA